MAKRIKLRVTSSRCDAEGIEIYLDEYDSKEEAIEALGEEVLGYLDWGYEEVEESKEG